MLKKAYDDGLILPGMIQYEHFNKALKEGKQRCLERLKTDLEQQAIDDIHDSMSWWACFNEESQIYSAQDPDDLIDYSPHILLLTDTLSKIDLFITPRCTNAWRVSFRLAQKI